MYLCRRCEAQAENYIADYDAYLCDNCYSEYKQALIKFWEAFIHSDNTVITHQCSLCKYSELDCIDYPCNACKRAIYGLSTDMFDSKENNNETNN